MLRLRSEPLEGIRAHYREAITVNSNEVWNPIIQKVIKTKRIIWRIILHRNKIFICDRTMYKLKRSFLDAEVSKCNACFERKISAFRVKTLRKGKALLVSEITELIWWC